ncbi:selenoprotein [Tetrabaena socialis]|uniref:Selenoprotein F n=1 Tax=Tetrabaena socialis TaxID=47790 RepID=A0A2J8A5L2_9CHLO|nr:selenoprotein [Tetrabaena socialis]|eukprot:PNH07822.1 selenoprotein [Tetrabaena socialis]
MNDIAMKSTMIALLVALLALSVRAAEEPSCDALGFTGDVVCSDCDVLVQFVKDAELEADCRRCCVKDTVTSKRFHKAELVVDQWRANTLPEIKQFIEKHAKSFAPALKVLYSQNSSPKLRLSGPDGSEAVRIDNWKAASIAEFLKERLTPVAVTGSAATA